MHSQVNEDEMNICNLKENVFSSVCCFHAFICCIDLSMSERSLTVLCFVVDLQENSFPVSYSVGIKENVLNLLNCLPS